MQAPYRAQARGSTGNYGRSRVRLDSRDRAISHKQDRFLVESELRPRFMARNMMDSYFEAGAFRYIGVCGGRNDLASGKIPSSKSETGRSTGACRRLLLLMRHNDTFHCESQSPETISS